MLCAFSRHSRCFESVTHDAVIFDMDGVLVDSERIIRDGFAAAADTLGHALNHELFAQLIGTTSARTEAILKARFGEDFPLERMYAIAREHIDEATADGWPRRPGALALAEQLHAHGVPIAVASSTRRAGVEARLASTGLLPFVGAICAGDEVREGKPHPEIYERAAQRLGVAPQRCVGIEDSLHGIRAAHAAGLRTVLVPDLVAAPDPRPPEVHHVFENLDAVRPALSEWLGIGK